MGSYNNKSVVCRVILRTQFRLIVIVLINRIVTDSLTIFVLSVVFFVLYFSPGKPR